MKKLILLAFVFLVGCGSGSDTQHCTDTVEYIDRNVTVTEYVDRNVTVTETVTEYVDRNITIEIEPYECKVVIYDSKFKGRIIYEDKSPYKRGVVRVQGEGYEAFAFTDDLGNFEIGVKGDERFIFSAASPFGDFLFYAYAKPLLVQKYSEDGAYECEYNEDIFTCYEKELIK